MGSLIAGCSLQLLLPPAPVLFMNFRRHSSYPSADSSAISHARFPPDQSLANHIQLCSIGSLFPQHSQYSFSTLDGSIQSQYWPCQAIHSFRFSVSVQKQYIINEWNVSHCWYIQKRSVLKEETIYCCGWKSIVKPNDMYILNCNYAK